MVDVPDGPETSAPEPIRGDAASLREAGEELERARAAGELAPHGEPAPTPAPPTKLTDGAETPLTARQAGKQLGRLRAQEQERSKNYQAAATAATAEIDERFRALPADQQQMAEPVRQAAAELLEKFSDVIEPKDLAALRESDSGRAARFDYLAGLIKAGTPALPPVEQPDQDLDLQQRHAALEQQKQDLELERRVAQLDPAMRERARIVEQAGIEFQQAFSDIKTTDDLAKLQASDPQRYALYEHCRGLLTNGVQGVYAALQEQYVAGKARYAAASAEHDRVWFEKHPEFADPAVLQRDQSAAVAALERAGVTAGDLDDLWSGSKSIDLRHPAAQELLWMAGQWVSAQQALEQSRADARNGKQLPAPIRPGVGRDHAAEGRHERIDRLNRRISNSSGHTQMKLLAERLTLQQKER